MTPAFLPGSAEGRRLAHCRTDCSRQSSQVPWPEPKPSNHPIQLLPVEVLPVVDNNATCISAVLIISPPEPTIEWHIVICLGASLHMTKCMKLYYQCNLRHAALLAGTKLQLHRFALTKHASVLGRHCKLVKHQVLLSGHAYRHTGWACCLWKL